MDDAVLMRVENLKMHFDVSKRLFSKKKTLLKAVDDVSLSLRRGRTFGLVGESGCGKTTLGRTIVRLYKPTAGRIWYSDADLSPLSDAALMPYRSKMQMIFQDSFSSLNPRMMVGDIIAEPLRIQHRFASAREERELVEALVERIGLRKDHISRYPHEFSGGQRQRIGIARALANTPEFIVCDEPISALDVSIQAQVINLLLDLQDQMGLTYLFVSHDLSMVRHISHEVGVMYLGHMVETAPVHELYSHMLHPYTEALMSAVPQADPDMAEKSRRIILQGDVPTPIDPPSGCPFRTRCPYPKPICEQVMPALQDVGHGHFVACHQAAGSNSSARSI
ncbi:MAG: ATP-binding cassette domain-containing protein [Oscillospiraceae bacterium]|jgi:oligopeptide transport system ATP-binding protein|nr:ATP-binding cassette domain-containing protein [Oscillospiraceae bacterium]